MDCQQAPAKLADLVSHPAGQVGEFRFIEVPVREAVVQLPFCAGEDRATLARGFAYGEYRVLVAFGVPVNVGSIPVGGRIVR